MLTRCVEPRAVTGLDLNRLVADLERERAFANLDQFGRAGVVSVAVMALTWLQRPRPQRPG